MKIIGLLLVVACFAWLTLEIIGLVKKVKEMRAVKNKLKEDKKE